MNLLPDNLHLPRQTVCGNGMLLKTGELAAQFGRRGIFVHGRSLIRSGVVDQLKADCKSDVKIEFYCHSGGEPTVDEVDELRAQIRNLDVEWVAAAGGGSVIDLAKAATGLAFHPEKTAFYQMSPQAIQPARLPLIAAPTTAGTGSEATVVSVLTNLDSNLKQSIRHVSHMPSLVILDPSLLASCPSSTIAAAGMDAFIQAFESYTSRYARPFTSTLAELALDKIAANLLPLFRNSADSAAAAQMLEASYIAGLAFSHSRLGLVHGLAHPLGIRFKAAHGIACACALPAVLDFNSPNIKNHLQTLRDRLNLNIPELIAEWMGEMQIENPFHGGAIADMDKFSDEVLTSGSTKANPRQVTADDIPPLIARITRR